MNNDNRARPDELLAAIKEHAPEEIRAALHVLHMELSTTIAMLDDKKIMSAFFEHAPMSERFLVILRRIYEKRYPSMQSPTEGAAHERVLNAFEETVRAQQIGKQENS